MFDLYYSKTHENDDVTSDTIEIRNSVNNRLEFVMTDNKSGEVVTMFFDEEELGEIANIIDLKLSEMRNLK